ncbi:hypothetical protein Tco_0742194 [Tanacetum coccineum]
MIQVKEIMQDEKISRTQSQKMKAQDQDHINDTERMLSVILSNDRDQSHYKTEKDKDKTKEAKLQTLISSTLREHKVNQDKPPISSTSTLERTKKTSTWGEELLA